MYKIQYTARYSRCCVMDTALVDGKLYVVEFNTINSSGFYDNDVEKIIIRLYNYAFSLELTRNLGSLMENFIGDYNDEVTRNKVRALIESYGYKVVCDSSNNTPYDIDTGKLFADIESTTGSHIRISLHNT